MTREETISIGERRRRAPFHFWAKAANARFAANVIHHATDGDQSLLAESIGYTGSQSIALHEAFLREASIALELIIKAAIAQRIEIGISREGLTSVPFSHDLVSLWSDAG